MFTQCGHCLTSLVYILNSPMGHGHAVAGRCTVSVLGNRGDPFGVNLAWGGLLHVLASCPHPSGPFKETPFGFTVNKAECSKRLPTCRLDAEAWHNKGSVHWTIVLALFAGPLR